MLFKINHDEVLKLALNLLPSKYGLIGEIGCGDGNFAELLDEIGVRNYLGIDISREKIVKVKKKFPKLNFHRIDILDFKDMFDTVDVIVSFQTLEHIKDDIQIIKWIRKGATLIFSVPNRKYAGHKRWFELKGWKKRYSPYIDFEYEATIQNPRKVAARSFLFKGVRK